MSCAEYIISLLHKIPHFTFKFKRITTLFSINYNSDYAQSIVLLSALLLIIGGFLSLTIIITWICQCCKVHNASVKSRKQIRHLSFMLFFITIICFLFLGICLFGNEQMTRGITASVSSASDVTQNFKLAAQQCNGLHDIRKRTIGHLDSLTSFMQKEMRKHPEMNKTAFIEVEDLMNSSKDKMEMLGANIERIKSLLSVATLIEKGRIITDRIELERWFIFVTLLSIMFVVLFAGIIGFCRQSKKGAVVFSGLGFSVFIVGWLLLTVSFPAAVFMGDFCANDGDFLRNYISNETVDMLNFYRSCDSQPTHDNLPATMRFDEISVKLSMVQSLERSIETTIGKLFNRTVPEIESILDYLSNDISQVMKGVGALESTLACYTYRNDFVGIEKGFCYTGIISVAIITASLILLGFSMFLLLLMVSKSWHLFTKLPSDYIEVDEDDVFFPRGNDSAIPIDIYGTHVYNPRTRLANSLDRADPSTGTTTATAGLPNDFTISNHVLPTTALIESGGSPTPPWQRGAAGTSTLSTENAPPAYNSYGLFRGER